MDTFNVIILYMGSPQDRVISPLLCIIFTDSCWTSKEGSYLVKAFDDTALLSLLQGSESNHGRVLLAFVK